MDENILKQNTAQGLGNKLKEIRKHKNIPLELAAQKLNISLRYLQAIEEDRFDYLPAGLYGKNYIRDYAKLLGLPISETRKWLNKNFDPINENSDPFSNKVLSRRSFIAFPRMIRNLILLILFSACLLYLAFYFKKIVFPPKLEIFQPDKNLKMTDNSLKIIGKTEAEAEISINGETVLNNNNGNFTAEIKLKKGINNILIKAKKKYSGENSVLRQILVE